MDPKWQIAAVILQFIMTTVMGVFAWMGKRIIAAQDQQIADHGNRINALESKRISREEFERLATNVDDSVTKEEWLRSHGTTQQMLRQMKTSIDEMNGRQSAAVEIATAMAAAINAQGKA